MSKYIEALKRRKKGERHVEIISSLPENKKDFVEQFRKEHPNTSTEWFDRRFNEKMSLDEIIDLLDGISVLKENITVLSAGTVTLYPIAKDCIKSFRNAILEQVSHEKSDRGELFFTGDVIRWMEEKRRTDSEFIYRLNSDFVDDYKRRHLNFATENELLKKMNFFNC